MEDQLNTTLPDWPGMFAQPRVTGRLKTVPEDFRVDEESKVDLAGEGPHLFLQVQKTQANTNWVAQKLAEVSGCPVRDVGFAGMKDRQAVTTQWYSIPCENREDHPWQNWDIEGVKILQSARHQRKLRRGLLKGNRFSIIVRELKGDLEGLLPRLNAIKTRGLPNYFGSQRFGHHGANVSRGVRYLLKGGRLPRSKRSIYLSAVRSFLFNQVLASRVELENWDELLEGEVVMLDGTHSVFHHDSADKDLPSRCSRLDIHPTGPMPGAEHFSPQGAALELETKVLEPYSDWVDALSRARINADRRSLRLRVTDLDWELKEDQLELFFLLPAGAYATTLVKELVSTVV
jgi:tRNA pseudouridine13 synthase